MLQLAVATNKQTYDRMRDPLAERDVAVGVLTRRISLVGAWPVARAEHTEPEGVLEEPSAFARCVVYVVGVDGLVQRLAPQLGAAGGVEPDDGVVLAVDFGPSGEATVDVVDGTVIVVVGDEQHEMDVEGSADASISNGVLTIEVEQ